MLLVCGFEGAVRGTGIACFCSDQIDFIRFRSEFVCPFSIVSGCRLGILKFFVQLKKNHAVSRCRTIDGERWGGPCIGLTDFQLFVTAVQDFRDTDRHVCSPKRNIDCVVIILPSNIETTGINIS